MVKQNTPERKEMLKKRREAQLSRTPTILKFPSGKYVPAGKFKNLKPHNR